MTLTCDDMLKHRSRLREIAVCEELLRRTMNLIRNRERAIKQAHKDRAGWIRDRDVRLQELREDRSRLVEKIQRLIEMVERYEDLLLIEDAECLPEPTT